MKALFHRGKLSLVTLALACRGLVASPAAT